MVIVPINLTHTLTIMTFIIKFIMFIIIVIYL